MKELLNWLVMWIAKVHDKIMTLNDDHSIGFNDKQLHFLVIGLFGLMLVFAVYPVFKALAKRKKYMTLTWIYAFTIMIILTFAIEIGQGISHTGTMDMQDVVWGMTGFMTFFLVWCLIRAIYHGILYLIHQKQKKRESH